MKGAETKNVLLAIDNLYQFENNIIIALVSRIPKRYNKKILLYIFNISYLKFEYFTGM